MGAELVFVQGRVQPESRCHHRCGSGCYETSSRLRCPDWSALIIDTSIRERAAPMHSCFSECLGRNRSLIGRPVPGVFLPNALQQVAISDRKRRSLDVVVVAWFCPFAHWYRDAIHRAVCSRESCGTMLVADWQGGSGRIDRPVADGSDGLQQAWAHLCPPDQQQSADGVERGFSYLASDERIGDIECQCDDAGEDQKAASGPELIQCCAVKCEVAGTEEKAQDGEVHGLGPPTGLPRPGHPDAAQASRHFQSRI